MPNDQTNAAETTLRLCYLCVIWKFWDFSFLLLRKPKAAPSVRIKLLFPTALVVSGWAIKKSKISTLGEKLFLAWPVAIHDAKIT